MSSSGSSVINDPRTKYAKPPFPTQHQDIPGVDKKMEPTPDHGENSYQGSGKLEGLVAVITGGDSGIGRAIALAYAREGADVVFTYLAEMEDQDAEETERLVTQAGRRVASYRIDQSIRAECDRVIDETVRNFGRLDILVNNAALQGIYPSLEDIPDGDIDRFFKVNIESMYYLSRAALKHLSAGGSIINTSSIQAFDPGATLSPYAATKAAIANFTLSLAKLAIKQGVRVNAVAPGPVWTPLIASTVPDGAVEKFGASCLFERPAQPAELAPVYVFLASDDASFVSGEIYGVTGGLKQI